MNLSKRTLILTAVAILGIVAAVFSVYLEKRETEKEFEDLAAEEVETKETELAEARRQQKEAKLKAKTETVKPDDTETPAT
jgi:hypothetical protein